MQVLLSDDKIMTAPREIDGVLTIVVKDGFGNPIFVAIQQDENNVLALDASDPKFDSIVATLPITKRKTVVERMSG
jgi:hypothetical protein